MDSAVTESVRGIHSNDAAIYDAFVKEGEITTSIAKDERDST